MGPPPGSRARSPPRRSRLHAALQKEPDTLRPSVFKAHSPARRGSRTCCGATDPRRARPNRELPVCLPQPAAAVRSSPSRAADGPRRALDAC